MRTLLALGLLASCGGDSSPSTADASIDTFVRDGQFDGPSLPFTLTSPTITDGGAFPLSGACTSKGGQNQSPQLVFTNAPAGTQSFAVVLTDMSNALVHCAIYDVPGTATGPAGERRQDLRARRRARCTPDEQLLGHARLRRPLPAECAHLSVQGLRARDDVVAERHDVDDEGASRVDRDRLEPGHRDAHRDVHAVTGRSAP